MLIPESVIVIGAGLTGLSTAYHLGGGRILEKEGEVGGLCRSYRSEGYTFDFTGHLLHIKDPGVRELIERLAPGLFDWHERRAMIWSNGRLTKYPFQANLWGLPPEVVEECLEGLRQARAAAPREPADDFRGWIVETFGQGIARHFMIPYNRKLWRVPLEELTTEWVAGLVPVPKLEEAVRGASAPEGVTLGYNARFLYPSSGGIAPLPRAFAAHTPRLHLACEVVEIDVGNRKLTCRNGETYHYEVLVSTMPLPLLVRALKPAPTDLAEASEALRYVSVFDLNLGVRREGISEAHWIYFPEERYPFYRVGFPSNINGGLAPERCSSAYVEVAHLPDRPVAPDEVVDRSLEGLRDCGILRPDDDIHFRDLVHIPYAYVIFDRGRRESLPGIVSWLRERGIYSVGRYGGWQYYSMEDAILAGMSTAAEIIGHHG